MNTSVTTQWIQQWRSSPTTHLVVVLANRPPMLLADRFHLAEASAYSSINRPTEQQSITASVHHHIHIKYSSVIDARRTINREDIYQCR